MKGEKIFTAHDVEEFLSDATDRIKELESENAELKEENELATNGKRALLTEIYSLQQQLEEQKTQNAELVENVTNLERYNIDIAKGDYMHGEKIKKYFYLTERDTKHYHEAVEELEHLVQKCENAMELEVEYMTQLAKEKKKNAELRKEVSGTWQPKDLIIESLKQQLEEQKKISEDYKYELLKQPIGISSLKQALSQHGLGYIEMDIDGYNIFVTENGIRNTVVAWWLHKREQEGE